MAFVPLSLGNFNTSKEPLSTSLTKINDMIEELYTFSEEGDLTSISQNIVPDQDDLRDLGSIDKKWRSLYVSGNTIYLGNSEISVDDQGNLSVNGESIAATTWENVLGRPEIPASIFDLDVSPTIIRPSFLKYDGSSLSWVELSTVAESGSYNDLSNSPSTILDLGVTDGNNNDVLTTDGNGTFSFQAIEGLKQRSTVQAATIPLAPNASDVLSLSGYRTYTLLKVSVNNAAWVRIYSSQAALTADANRPIIEDADSGIGLVAEILTSGAQTINMSPTPIGFNDDSPVTETIWVSVVNNSQETVAIQVSVTVLQLEK